MTDTIQIMNEALHQWKCPSCGGKKTYPQRTWAVSGGPPTITEVPCKVCGQSGLHPIAETALRDCGFLVDEMSSSG